MDKVIVYGVIFLLFFGSLAIFGYVKSTVQDTVSDTVVKTERVQDGDSSKYIIYGRNEVYEDVDTFWFGKFNSSDFYRDIQAGHSYQFTVVGWRVPFLSWYRNIVKYEEIK